MRADSAIKASKSDTMPSDGGAHMYSSAVRLPRMDGIVPHSWLESRHLRTSVESRQHPAR